MKKRRWFVALILTISMIINVTQMQADVYAAGEEPSQLYGQSVLLLDGDSGRVLFEKNGYEKRPMASTTKIMTCIVALEQAGLDEVVVVSERAAKAPDVQMNICTGEEYYLGDLLYGLMLESYNDVAMAIMDHIPDFIAKMNAKAVELGCADTHFVTPNGLDGEDDAGVHSTTARDLATIMRYCIKNQDFLTITETDSYTIDEIHGARTATAHNHNALLKNYDNVISGKTGFTGNAGYCYVGAVQEGERTFIAVTLASGWPPHKGYKWEDMRKLFDYAKINYQYHDYDLQQLLPEYIDVEGGQTAKLGEHAQIGVTLEKETLHLLTADSDIVKASLNLPEQLAAPVVAGNIAGTVGISVNDNLYETIPVTFANGVEPVDFSWCLDQIFKYFVEYEVVIP
ncbi:MAG: D-alanyl-D-alanine carboxypeptidase [Lachnospiraceae bacterium]|nr:D-alanyl-D-alanine carboxypeptidase [Lachnospiraceae bacterium]